MCCVCVLSVIYTQFEILVFCNEPVLAVTIAPIKSTCKIFMNFIYKALGILNGL